MARTNQKLINYNTGTQGNIPVASALTHGEIAVRYNQNDPALFIKDNDDNIVTFIASGAIATAIENAQGNVSSLSAAVETFSGAVDTYKTTTDGRLDNLEESAHTHENKSVLDGISAGQITGWDLASAQTHTHSNKALLDTYTQTESDLADAVLKKHEHTNMDVLTALTPDEVAKWNASAHNHANKDVLDGITSEKVTAWDNAVNSAITGVTVNDEAATISNHVAQITINEASASEKGLMSSADKAKLDTIAPSAQTNVIESVKVDGTALTITDKAVDILLTGYAQSIEYDSNAKTINLKNSKGETLDTVDATDFIKDGMVDNVTIGINSATSEQCLIVTFNTAAGKEPIYIKIDDIFDADNYYTKTDADTQIANASARSVNSAVTYVNWVSGQIETTVNNKANKSEVTTLSGDVVTELNKKVDKQTGYSLIADSEITRLAKMSNSIATPSASGYMSSEMVTKLNSIDDSAQVNQKALATVTGNTGTYTATAETDTFSIVSNKTDLVSTKVDGSVVTIDVKFSAATQDAAGLMTSADKTKLDGMADGTAIQAISALTYANSANITTLSGSVVSDYYTKTEVNGYLSAKTDVDTFKAVSGVVETNSGNIYTLSGEVVSHYATSSNTYSAIDAVNKKVNELSGATPNDFVFTTIDNANADHTQSGAKSRYNSDTKEMQLDLTNLVIDCGTF